MPSAPRSAPLDQADRRTVLLVEDSPGDAALVREMLAHSERYRDPEHQVRVADAVRWLSANRADCILLDLSLPDAEGLEALIAVQGCSAGTPIVVLSGRADQDIAVQAVVAGARDFLKKGSVDPERLERALDHAIEHEESTRSVAALALHDPLTGLPNRTLLVDRLGTALGRAARSPDRAVGVLFVDLDHFKLINDSLGHGAGDELLASAARRLEAVVRPGDTVARFGGDEFVVCCETIPGWEQAVTIAERIVEELSRPFLLDGREREVSASVGIALCDGDAARPETLLRDADIALYEAKRSGRSRHATFSTALRERAQQRLDLHQALRRALRRDELRLLYQPVVSLRDGATVAWEALLRWERPGHALLPPADFLAVAEDSDVIVDIGHWVLGQACREAARWRVTLGDAAPRVLVNVSPRQFADRGLVDQVRTAARNAGVEPDAIGLELTETVLLKAAAAPLHSAGLIRALGTGLLLDDFGTGHASLSHLKSFPVDSLKIDRSFVAGLESDADDAKIVQAVIGLAKSLGKRAIAEGIEEEAQLARLCALDCDQGQGFLFAAPMPAEEVERYMDGEPPWSAQVRRAIGPSAL